MQFLKLISSDIMSFFNTKEYKNNKLHNKYS